MLCEYINGKAVGHDILKEISEGRKPKVEAKAEIKEDPKADPKK